MTRLAWTLLSLSLVLPGTPSAARETPPPFPVRNVTLYDCGLAQVERSAQVQGAVSLDIPLQLAHLDDLLASLILATDGGVRVRGVRFPSVRNAAQAAAGSGFGSAVTSVQDETLTLPGTVEGFAAALVGTGVELTRRSGAERLSGTVLACVEGEPNAATPPQRDGEAPGPPPPRPRALVVASDGGILTWVPLADVERIRPLSAREAEALESFAGHIGRSNGFRDVSVTIETTAGSSGTLAAGYIQQIPVWRMAYKTTVTDGAVTLEAWSIVHNDSREDWRDVGLTLVSGLPTSYVLSLATPRYGEREPLWLAEDRRMLPQLGGESPDSLLYDWISPATAFGYGAASYSVAGSGYGHGAGASASVHLGTLSTSGRPEGVSSLLQVGEAAAEEAASGKVEQEISTYRSLSPVTLPAGTSGMVPLLRHTLPGEAFTALNLGEAPSTCVRAENSTGLVLQEGISSVYIDGRFRGQVPVARTEPEEIRVWCFGGDPDLSHREEVAVDETDKALEWRREGLWVHHVKTTTRTYSVENRAGQPRRIAIGIPRLDNGRVVKAGELREAEDGTRLHLAQVPARGVQTEVIVTEEGRMRRLDLAVGALEELLKKAGEIPGEELEVVAGALPSLRQAEAARERIRLLEQERAGQAERAQRTRENLKAVPPGAGSTRAVDRMLKDLMDLEEQIRDGEEQQRALEARETEHRNAAQEVLRRLSRAGS
ncbi:MAG: hypothetical protein FJ098_07280 [Deltaproteobacteria bacterium]|nr:hypothetical protein [Deltaproteobacteria bacterium]